MSRVEKPLDLRQETWARLEQIQKALGHDEVEETIQVLVELGMKAVAISGKENPVVHLMGGNRKEEDVRCVCGKVYKRVVFTKESLVNLGIRR